MSHRLNLAQAAVMRWHIPDLDATTAQDEPRRFFETALGAPAPPIDASPIDLPTSVGTEQASVVVQRPAAPLEGHAESLERGLREGREQGYAEGFLVGQRAAEQQFAAQIERFEAIIHRLGEPVRALERRLRRQ